MWGTLLVDATVATMAPGGNAYGLRTGCAVGIADGRVAWLGDVADLPGAPAQQAREVIACHGALVTPGLVDCHTHLIHGGHRAREFELRLEGASYEELARAGGGIASTVAATRAASEESLVASALPRLDALLAEGVTTVEIKSGYGLDTATELRMLRAARRLGELRPVTVVTTFLGAHALPPEHAGRADRYIDLVCEEMLPAVAAAGLADAVDAFCEGIGFSPAQVERVLDRARALGLPRKIHAEQLSNLHGAALAARMGALSADHLEYLDEDDVSVLAAHGTVAVLLPGAFYFLGETRRPPVAALRAAGVAMALATDANPGSSPLTSPLLVMNMGCVLFRLTPEEALAGMTRVGAGALGLGEQTGTVACGMRADLACWDVAAPAELAYRIGYNPLRWVMHRGLRRDAGPGLRGVG